MPSGFLEPELWRKMRCVVASIAIRNGSKKWREKKRVRVAFLIPNPPQIHSTRGLPT